VLPELQKEHPTIDCHAEYNKWPQRGQPYSAENLKKLRGWFGRAVKYAAKKQRKAPAANKKKNDPARRADHSQREAIEEAEIAAEAEEAKRQRLNNGARALRELPRGSRDGAIRYADLHCPVWRDGVRIEPQEFVEHAVNDGSVVEDATSGEYIGAQALAWEAERQKREDERLTVEALKVRAMPRLLMGMDIVDWIAPRCGGEFHWAEIVKRAVEIGAASKDEQTGYVEGIPEQSQLAA
jgi:hypothetical protein